MGVTIRQEMDRIATMMQLRDEKIRKYEKALKEIADDPTGVSIIQASIAKEALDIKD